MKNYLAVTIYALTFILNAPIYSYADTETKVYDQQAKLTPSKNDIKAFVYRWFAGLEHQYPAEYFERTLSKTNLSLGYPGYTVTNFEEFKEWYEYFEKTVQWNAHKLKINAIKRNYEGEYDVEVEDCWHLITYDKENYNMQLRQGLVLGIENGKLVLLKATIAVLGTCDLPSEV